jgi:peptidoglycan/xylan/chitin deacetylase (PgdA/CDA1 family)
VSVGATTIRRGVKGTAELVDRLRRPPAGLVVLAYHRVGRRSTVDVDLPLPAFEAQMAWLAATGRVVSLDQAVARLADGSPVEDAVVLTFDDGTSDFAEVALPVLVAHRLPATIYVATRFVDEGLAFPDGGTPVSWVGLADAVATGLVTVGSHTHGHRLLDRVDAATAESELGRSVALIGDRLGVDARHFAYPKGLAGSPAADGVVRRRFTTAAVGGCHANVPGSTDLHLLARSAVQVSDGWRWFERKVDGGMRLEDSLRRLANRRRYRQATT